MLYSTPGGIFTTERTEERWPTEFMRMIAVLADTASDAGLNLQCARCHQNLVGKNAREDTKWIMECACRTYVGGNPLRGRES